MKEARKEYKRLVKAADDWQTCANPEHKHFRASKKYMDPHHLQGKKTPATIVKFVWICRECHRKTHDNPAWAEGVGLLERNRT